MRCPSFISDDAPVLESAEDVNAEEETTEVEALAAPAADVEAAPEFVEVVPPVSAGAVSSEFYGQIFEFARAAAGEAQGPRVEHAASKCCVRDAQADNEFACADRGVAGRARPEREFDLDRIVVGSSSTWLGENRGAWESGALPASR